MDRSLHVDFVRVLRTQSSERFLLCRSGVDAAALDIHYLADGTVHATLIVFEGSSMTEEEIPGQLMYIDEMLLPEVSLNDRKLLFTVVVGRVLGAFEPMPDALAMVNEDG